MAQARSQWLDSSGLGPDVVLGSWRIQSRGGRGTYGVVYRAEREGQPQAGSFALKLATHPYDPRYEREAQLLARIRHPHVPLILDRGWWEGAGKLPYPYLVMQWVEGVPLYEWPKARALTSRQVLRVLAQVARALEATHAAGCVHRDVKGDNVLVDRAGKAVLLDFGAGTYAGARRLTYEPLPPGTRPYRSPQSLRFQWKHRRSSSAHYEATPADDVYALGVTAFYLCTGTYPPPATDPSAVGDDGRATPEALVSPGELVTLSLELEGLILRMLSDEPLARGTAAELAVFMEKAAERAKSEADEPIVPRACHAPTLRTDRPGPPRRPVSALAAAGLTIAAAWAVIIVSASLNPQPEISPFEAEDFDVEEGSAAGLGDASVTFLGSVSPPEPVVHGLAVDLPKGPFKGQRKPPCIPRLEVEIRGGCWVQVGTATAPCGEAGYEWRGACYVPSFPTPRQPTSEQP